MNRTRRTGTTGLRGTIVLPLALVLSLPATWGCAVFRDPTPPGFGAIEIRAEVERDRKGQLEGDLEAFSTLKGVLVGAALGGPTFAVVAGGATLGVALGACAVPSAATLAAAIFAYPFCVVGATVIATAVGFVVGLGGGIWVGATGGLPAEIAEQVTETLTEFESRLTPEADLLSAMQQATPESKQVGTGEAEAVVTARLEELELRQHSKDTLSLRFEAEMVQTWKSAEDGRPQDKTCDYRFDTAREPAEGWLADGGRAFDEAFALGMETLARWMNRDLEAFSYETEFEETEEDPESCFREWRWYDYFLLF